MDITLNEIVNIKGIIFISVGTANSVSNVISCEGVWINHYLRKSLEPRPINISLVI